MISISYTQTKSHEAISDGFVPQRFSYNSFQFKNSVDNNSGHLLSILFVDDDADESYLFNEALEHACLQVQLLRATDGNDLLLQLKLSPTPDLVFMDMNMPHKDGLETLVEIRQNQKFAKLPVVIYSTTKDDTSIDKCFKNGANLFVIKPNNFDGLVRIVKHICSISWTNFPQPAREQFVITEDL